MNEALICLKREAIRKGRKTYFTGKPCPKCLTIGERVVDTGQCCECIAIEAEIAKHAAKREKSRIQREERRQAKVESDKLQKAYQEAQKEERKLAAKRRVIEREEAKI